MDSIYKYTFIIGNPLSIQVYICSSVFKQWQQQTKLHTNTTYTKTMIHFWPSIKHKNVRQHHGSYDLEIFGTGKVDPLELELELATLDVPEPKAHVLHYLPVPPNHAALLRQTVAPARLYYLDSRVVREAAWLQLQRLHERPDVKLRVTHWVVHAECVVVVYILDSKKSSQTYIVYSLVPLYQN